MKNSVDLQKTTGFKFTCRSCGAYWFMPVDGFGSNPPAQCISCGKDLPPWRPLKRLTDELVYVAESWDKAGIDLSIEVEDRKP